MEDLPRHEQLAEALQIQMKALDSSCRAFDSGDPWESLRLAVTVRVLVHDTKASHSLLGQLGVKEQLLFPDGSRHASFRGLPPIGPSEVTSIPGLAMMADYGDHTARVPAFLAGGLPPHELEFEDWWKLLAIKDTQDNLLSRRQMVLQLANKDGGAHVDLQVDAGYNAIHRGASMGWNPATGQLALRSDGTTDAGSSTPEHSPIPGCMRQVAAEVRVTVRRHCAHLLGPDVAADPPASTIPAATVYYGGARASFG